MKRKQIAIVSILFLVLLVLAGCYWTPAGGTGALSFNLGQTLSSSRQISGSYDTARIYLLSENGTYYQFSEGVIYYEIALDTGTETEEVTLEDIPVGNWYVIASIGNKTADGIFIPDVYGKSVLTPIAAGTNNVTITQKNSPFRWAENLIGKKISGVAAFGTSGDTIFASSGNSLYSGSDTASLTAMTAVPAGYTVNSISKGTFFDPGSPTTSSINELWVNTDKGILPYDSTAETYDTSFFQAADPVSVEESGGLYEPAGDNDANVTIFYKTDEGFGGTNVTESERLTPSTWEWLDLTEAFQEFFSGEIIYQFFIHDGYSYFATKLGAFRLDNASISSGGSGDFFADAKFFKILDQSGSEIQIYGMAYQAPGGILLSTANGVYTADLDTATDAVVGDPHLISGTQGVSFWKTDVSDNGDYAAALSASSLYLFKRSAGVMEMKAYPFYTGVPGDITAITWIENSSTLLIAGDGTNYAPEGLAEVDASGITYGD